MLENAPSENGRETEPLQVRAVEIHEIERRKVGALAANY
jgi:hypothetical protein